MSSPAQSQLSPSHGIFVAPARPHHGDDLRPPAERAQLIAVWTGIIVFCLAFWAAVAALVVH